MKKKLLSTLLAMALLTSSALAAPVFPDVAADSVSGGAIYKMADAGILNGMPDGSFQPGGSLTRAAFVKIVNLTFGYRETDDALPGFLDVPQTHWAYEQVRIARRAGYIEGVGGGKFDPEGVLTREQVCVILDRILKFRNLLGDKVVLMDPVSPWAKVSVENAILCGAFLLEEGGKFRATEAMTRAEVCVGLEGYVVGAAPSQPTAPSDDSGQPGGGYTDEQVAEEKLVAGYLKTMVTAFERKDLDAISTYPAVKTSLTALMRTMKEALAAREEGAFLTRDYINEHYSAAIRSFVKAYQAMTKDEKDNAKGIISGLDLYPDEIQKVMDYFEVDMK
jgi:hypothetical protein